MHAEPIGAAAPAPTLIVLVDSDSALLLAACRVRPLRGPASTPLPVSHPYNGSPQSCDKWAFPQNTTRNASGSVTGSGRDSLAAHGTASRDSGDSSICEFSAAVPGTGPLPVARKTFIVLGGNRGKNITSSVLQTGSRPSASLHFLDSSVWVGGKISAADLSFRKMPQMNPEPC